jgi:hypothetical protein
MSAAVYNVSIALGLVLSAVGAGAQWGWPVGAMVGGALVLALTIVSARLAAGVR